MMRRGSLRSRVLLAVARQPSAEADIARRAQLSVAKTSKIVSALLNRGMLRFSGGAYHLTEAGTTHAIALGWAPQAREVRRFLHRGLESMVSL